MTTLRSEVRRPWPWAWLVLLLLAAPALALPGRPGALAPDGPSMPDPRFSWDPVAGADSYRLQVRDASNQVVFNRWYAAEETGCRGGAGPCSVQPALALEAAAYRWKVIARSPERSTSRWSRWLVFFPGLDGPPRTPPSPEPASPAGAIETSRPVFAWNAVPGGSRYRIHVRDSDNRVVLNRWRKAAAVDCTAAGERCELAAPQALKPGAYRWRLLARNTLTGKRGPWSDWQPFELPPLATLGSGLDARPVNDACRLPAPPPEGFGAAIKPVSGVPIDEAVILLTSPIDDRWFSVEKTGKVLAFDSLDPESAEAELVLDISDRTVADTGETGLLGMAFHPAFPADPRAFLFYTNVVDGAYVSYLSEFLTPDDGLTLDPASERHLLTVTGHATHNHKGGTIAFGPDGYLYAGLGDGGSPATSQDPFSLFGSLLRIDVDRGAPYAIPPDNPFADGLSGAPEVYAYGFRNPWRWSFDPSTGDLWLTDVGHTRWEEINLIEPGANYGWPIFEGPACNGGVRCDGPGLVPPLHAYPHDATGGYVIIGGFVYRGSAFPELQGRFIFADGSDRIWALFFDAAGQPDPRVLFDGGLPGSIARSLFEDESGELYLVKGRQLFKLVTAVEAGAEPFPEHLSETGCVAAGDPTIPAAGLVPYDVNNAFWTDGAAKSRWLALPDGERIGVAEDGDFIFPSGTVLVKEFRLGERRIETRLFARHDDGQWAGYSYAWNDEQTDAVLVQGEGRALDVDGQNYTIPSRNQCLTCHTSAAGRSLGLEVQQQNGDFHYPGSDRTANQLRTFELIDLFENPLPGAPEALPALTALDAAQASFSDRARSYLHSNCSSCHRPDGVGRGPADLRFQPLASMNICDVAPAVGSFGIEDARLLAPGEPERSVLSARLQALGAGAMPPIGKNLVDIDAAAVLDEFIAALEACP